MRAAGLPPTITVLDPMTMESGETPQNFTARLETRFREMLAQS